MLTFTAPPHRLLALRWSRHSRVTQHLSSLTGSPPPPPVVCCLFSSSSSSSLGRERRRGDSRGRGRGRSGSSRDRDSGRDARFNAQNHHQRSGAPPSRAPAASPDNVLPSALFRRLVNLVELRNGAGLDELLRQCEPTFIKRDFAHFSRLERTIKLMAELLVLMPEYDVEKVFDWRIRDGTATSAATTSTTIPNTPEGMQRLRLQTAWIELMQWYHGDPAFMAQREEQKAEMALQYHEGHAVSERFVFKLTGLLCGTTRHPEVMRLKRVAVADWLLERMVYELYGDVAMRQVLDMHKQLQLHGMVLKALVLQQRTQHAVQWMRRIMANRGIIPDRALVMLYLANRRLPAEHQIHFVTRLASMYNFVPDADIYAQLISSCGAEKNVELLGKVRKTILQQQQSLASSEATGSLIGRRGRQQQERERHWNERIAEAFMDSYAECGMYEYAIAMYDALPISAQSGTRVMWLAMVSMFEIGGQTQQQQQHKGYNLLQKLLQKFSQSKNGRLKGLFFNDLQRQKVRYAGDHMVLQLKKDGRTDLAERLVQFLDVQVGARESEIASEGVISAAEVEKVDERIEKNQRGSMKKEEEEGREVRKKDALNRQMQKQSQTRKDSNLSGGRTARPRKYGRDEETKNKRLRGERTGRGQHEKQWQSGRQRGPSKDRADRNKGDQRGRVERRHNNDRRNDGRGDSDSVQGVMVHD